MTVSVTSFPFGGVITPPQGFQQGRATPVAADGSALFHVTFLAPYATVVSLSSLAIIATSRIAVDELTVQASSLTLTGFDIYVGGGLPGSTVDVSWSSNGS